MKQFQEGDAVKLKSSDPQTIADKNVSDSSALNGGEILESKGKDEPKTLCKVCGTPMPLGASLCPTCKFFQNPVKRQFQFYASIVTLVVASASLLAWLGTTVPNLRRTLLPRHHLSVVSCNSADSFTLYNDGDKDLFVSHISMNMVDRTSMWQSPFDKIQAVVPSGQFYKYESPRPPKFESAEIIRGLPDPQWQQLLSQAVGNPECFYLNFFAQSDPFYQTLSNIKGLPLNTFPVHARLHYLVPGSNTTHYIDFSAIGIVRRNSSKACSGSQ